MQRRQHDPRHRRLERPTPSVTTSAFAARPPHPSCRARARKSSSGRGSCGGADVRLVHNARLAAAVALDTQESARERHEGLGQGLGARRQRIIRERAPNLTSSGFSP